VKLVNYAKDKVKFEDFNSVDKYNLVDLFVNNEKALLYIYRSLFQSDDKQMNTNHKQSPRSVKGNHDKKESYSYFVTEPKIEDQNATMDISRNESTILIGKDEMRKYQSLDNSIELIKN
jgi:hypothetical protein